MTLEQERSRPAQQVLPARESQTEDVVKVPDQEAHEERRSASRKQVRNSLLVLGGDKLYIWRALEDVGRPKYIREHDRRENDLVKHGISVNCADCRGVGS